MSPKPLNLLLTFAKTVLYVLGAMLVRFLIGAVASFHPFGELETVIWTAVLPALAGLIKLLTRLVNWDPAKAGR
jgi:hypothetical protein